MSKRDQLIYEGYRPDQVQLAEDFAAFVVRVVMENRDHTEQLRRGIDALAVKMNSLVPALEEGKKAGPVHSSELHEHMAPLDLSTVEEFIAVTGTIMLSGQDGPLGSAPALKNTIDELEAFLDQS